MFNVHIGKDKKKTKFVVKLADVHSHKLHSSKIDSVKWADAFGGRKINTRHDFGSFLIRHMFKNPNVINDCDFSKEKVQHIWIWI